MHIASVIHSSSYGGPHNQMALMAEGLLSLGHTATVILPEEPGDAAARLRRAGVTVVQFPLERPRRDLRTTLLKTAPRYLGQIRAMADWFRERGVDVVQTHGLLNADAAVAARMSGCGVVWQLIDTRPPPWLRRLLSPLIVRYADVVMTTGTSLSDFYPGLGAMGERHVPFIPAVKDSTPLFSDEDRLSVRSTLGLNGAGLVVGTLGNLNPQKGHERVVRVVEELVDERRDIRLRIRGGVQPGHETFAESLVEDATSRLGDGRAISTLEDALSPMAFYSALDVFVSAPVSNSEGIPTVALEAMAAGKPVLSTRVGALAEAIEDGESGFLVSSVPELQVRLRELVDDKQLREEIGRRARDVALSRFTVEKMMQAHLRAYNLAMARRRVAGR